VQQLLINNRNDWVSPLVRNPVIFPCLWDDKKKRFHDSDLGGLPKFLSLWHSYLGMRISLVDLVLWLCLPLIFASFGSLFLCLYLVCPCMSLLCWVYYFCSACIFPVWQANIFIYGDVLWGCVLLSLSPGMVEEFFLVCSLRFDYFLHESSDMIELSTRFMGGLFPPMWLVCVH